MQTLIDKLNKELNLNIIYYDFWDDEQKVPTRRIGYGHTNINLATTQQIREDFVSCDINLDGKLSYGEFVRGKPIVLVTKTTLSAATVDTIIDTVKAQRKLSAAAAA